jgi:hypothetical protein
MLENYFLIIFLISIFLKISFFTESIRKTMAFSKSNLVSFLLVAYMVICIQASKKFSLKYIT